MNVLPVIVREMRMQSRQPATYGLRVLGGGALLAIGALSLVAGGFGFEDGAELFRRMHGVLFSTIWLIVPLATADCISRERREGTLSQLFLTPLTVRDIVVAKGLTHGMRALMLGVGAVPVLMVPFLLGGVDWTEVGLSMAVNTNAFCWALGAGLLATSHNHKLARSLAWAMVWAACLFWVMTVLLGFLLWIIVIGLNFRWATLRRWDLGDAWELWTMSAETFFNPGVLPDIMKGFGRSGPWIPLLMDGIFLGVSCLGLWIFLEWAGRNVRMLSRDVVPSARRLKMERVFCSPSIARGFYRWWMRRKLERNPIGWLEQRTWQARLVTWSWLAVLVSIYSLILSGTTASRQILELNQGLFAHGLVGTMALTAAGSFRRERESGAMELLLVSPLSTRQLIWGRLRGIWSQFLPAVLLLATVWFYLAWIVLDPKNNLNGWFAREYLQTGLILTAFVAVPVIGLYFSLRCRHYMVALTWTVLVGWVMPGIVSLAGESASFRLYPDLNPTALSSDALYLALVYVVPALVQLGLAAVFLRWLRGNLETRNFAMGTPG